MKEDEGEGTESRGLEVCAACGWRFIKIIGHRNCRPDLGRAASELAASVSDVRSTKLGYGDSQITFELDDGFNVGLDVRQTRRGISFWWDYLHCLGELGREDAADLVRALRDWRRRCLLRSQDPPAEGSSGKDPAR